MNKKTIIFYDGDCVVCDLEMSIYKKQESMGLLKFVDINSDEFKEYSKDLDFFTANARMNVMRDGKKVDGIDAFLMIWEVMPGRKYKILSKIVNNKKLRPLFDFLYDVFAKYRKYLPKKSWFRRL